MPISSVARTLAARVAPRLQADVAERRPEIVRSAHPAPVRVAISVGFPVLVDMVPPRTEAGGDAILDEFGAMTIGDIASRLLEHNASKGRVSHATLRAFAHPQR